MSIARQLLTTAEYLALERAADHKSEFFNGEMFAMAGASIAHNLIALNVGSILRDQLRERPCLVLPSDMRVMVSETGLYTYPDVTVVCGEPRLEDSEGDTLLNPTLMVEVLSKSTEAHDRGEKFAQYRELESLREYVLIAQDRMRVERFLRREGSPEWGFAEVSGPDGRLQLASIDCELSLADVYEKVDLPASSRLREEDLRPR